MVLDAAAGLAAHAGLTGDLTGDLAAGLRRAEQSLDSGNAADVLDRWVALGRQAGRELIHTVVVAPPRTFGRWCVRFDHIAETSGGQGRPKCPRRHPGRQRPPSPGRPTRTPGPRRPRPAARPAGPPSRRGRPSAPPGSSGSRRPGRARHPSPPSAAARPTSAASRRAPVRRRRRRSRVRPRSAPDDGPARASSLPPGRGRSAHGAAP